MHWLAFLAACLALLLARNLRAPKPSTLFTGFCAFVLAFVLTTAGVRFAAHQTHLTRPSDYDAFLTHALEQNAAEPDAPVALFVGASFSRNALNADLLTKLLRKRGYPHRVINLSLEGASLQERNAQILAYLEHASSPPDIVFLEAAKEFDEDPVYVFNVAKFSDRAIEQFTPDATFWSMKGLAQGQCWGVASCVKGWGLLGIHAAMNATNLGLLATGESRMSIDAKPSFDPQTVRRETFALNKQEIAAALSVPSEINQNHTPITWSRLFRAEQRQTLEKAGVRRVAYYFPPVLPEEERTYFANLCVTEFKDYPCFAPIQPWFLKGLIGEHWYDEKHVLTTGSNKYTWWLDAQIEKRGALK